MVDAPPTDDMLHALTGCAYRLGLRFADEAEAASGQAMLAAYERFDRCFFSVRMAIGLQLRLRRPASAPLAAETERAQVERDPAERDPADHHTLPDPLERERERETERASLPRLITTLQAVADDAATLPGPPQGELLTLRELLATLTSTPAPAGKPDRPSGGLKTRLAATTASSVLAIPPSRHATGPPRR